MTHREWMYRVVFLTVPTQKFLSTRKNQSIRTVPMGTVLKCLSMVKVEIWEFSPKDFPEQQSKFWEQKISKFSDLEIFLSFTTGQPHIADRFPHNFIWKLYDLPSHPFPLGISHPFVAVDMREICSKHWILQIWNLIFHSGKSIRISLQNACTAWVLWNTGTGQSLQFKPPGWKAFDKIENPIPCYRQGLPFLAIGKVFCTPGEVKTVYIWKIFR